MLIDGDAFDGAVVAILGVVLGVLVAAVLIGVLLARLGGRRFGPSCTAVGLVVAVALAVDMVVVSRTIDGEVTPWDVVWAVVLTAGAVWTLRRLLR